LVESIRYKLVGWTGLQVSELCLGAMIFGDTLGLIDDHRALVDPLV